MDGRIGVPTASQQQWMPTLGTQLEAPIGGRWKAHDWLIIIFHKQILTSTQNQRSHLLPSI